MKRILPIVFLLVAGLFMNGCGYKQSGEMPKSPCACNFVDINQING